MGGGGVWGGVWGLGWVTSTRRRSIFFQNGGGKKIIKLTKSRQGKILRPEIERSDRPEARQNSGFGWRGHKKLKKSIYY